MNALTAPERSDLKRLEKVVRGGLQTAFEVGAALLEIRDQKLYREKAKTFEAYCQAEFEIDRSYAYRLIDAHEVNAIVKMSPIGDKIELNEWQCRSLSGVPEDEIHDVVTAAYSKAEGGKITSKLLRDARIERVKEARRAEPVETIDATPVSCDKPEHTVSAAELADEIERKHLRPCARQIGTLAKLIGGKGGNYELFCNGLEDCITAIRRMGQGDN